MSDHETEEKRGTKDRLLSATRKTFHTASAKASQYKRLVQKKIDLSSLHKKISSAHSELGKLVDDFREENASDILQREEITIIFQKLDSLKHAAALLEEEIESIRMEENLDKFSSEKESPPEGTDHESSEETSESEKKSE